MLYNYNKCFKIYLILFGSHQITLVIKEKNLDFYDLFVYNHKQKHFGNFRIN